MAGSTQVPVTSSKPVLVAAAGASLNPAQCGVVLLLADASVDVYLGGPTVSSSNGWVLAHAAAPTPVVVPLFPGDGLYAITASGSATVGALQMGV